MAKPQIDTHDSVTDIHVIGAIKFLNFSIRSGLLRSALLLQVITLRDHQ